MYKLANAGLWRYQKVVNTQEIVRALQYLGEVEDLRVRDPKRVASLAYDAIYVDEGQDFQAEEFRLLKELCCVPEGGEPNLYIFYDDAQNLYGRERPNWQSLGLSVRGRSFVMTQCFRNTKPIVEATLNVLYGSCAASKSGVPRKDFADLAGLEGRSLIETQAGLLRVKFAPRHGHMPTLSLATDPQKEEELLVARLRWLIGEQEVRPEDIMVLSYTTRRVGQLAEKVADAKIPGVEAVHVACDEKQKDRLLGEKGKLTLSTVASAKGYDAYCVLLASANEFGTDLKGRATFYVGCTRAIEYLEVFAYEKKGLAAEFGAVLERLS
jgi:superfamily I DNA and RNA helicase